MDREEYLFEALENLIRIRNECSCSIFSECGLSELTVRQIAYLRAISEEGDVTFSRLAQITRNSKPTITEMINKLSRMECVYRERSPSDRRILYIRLTEKGQKVAQADRNALYRLIGQVTDSLDEDEMDLLNRILRKVR